jgi:peptidoglycan/xylan/chitin deacetylase (PgdA/CDA1 family)
MEPEIQQECGQGPWIVETYYKNTRERAYFDTHDEARQYYEGRYRASKTLIHMSDTRHDIICCDNACWDSEGRGVATLLSDGEDNDEIICQRIQDGTLPFVPPHRAPIKRQFVKLAVRLFFRRRAVVHFGSAPYRYRSLCFFESSSDNKEKPLAALTIDDVPCRFPENKYSEVQRVQELLKKHNAKATFMLVGSWVTPQHRECLIGLLKDGHELGNHGMMDRSYEHDSPSDFGRDVDACSEIILNLQREAGFGEHASVKWFRAPHGRYTKSMALELAQRGLTNVMCDTYASCPIIEDSKFIAQHLTKNVQNGSIILLHMPEILVRQWCFSALEGLLEGLRTRNFQIVSVGELAKQRHIWNSKSN